MSAAQNGHTSVVETLVQHGANVDMQTDVSTNVISSATGGSGGCMYKMQVINLYMFQEVCFMRVENN